MIEVGIDTVEHKEGEYPFTPFVYVQIKQWNQSDWMRLTPQLMTDMEIDESVDHIIVRLQEAKAKAKKVLAEARGRM